jgi:hypothetical protein
MMMQRSECDSLFSTLTRSSSSSASLGPICHSVIHVDYLPTLRAASLRRHSELSQKDTSLLQRTFFTFPQSGSESRKPTSKWVKYRFEYSRSVVNASRKCGIAFLRVSQLSCSTPLSVTITSLCFLTVTRCVLFPLIPDIRDHRP